MVISAEDEAYLLNSMRAGEAILVLGAGASITSQNSRGEPVKDGRKLAATIAERAGLPYDQESLTDVLAAVKGSILGDPAIREILTKEYRGVTPSPELESLFSFTWKRLYTWNIDDSIENINRRSAQKRRIYNGLIDKAAEYEGPELLQVVHLHGEITKPEHSFILTDVEYAAALKSERHHWYQRAAQDYLAFCPVFIGTQLAEPILTAELERAKRDGNLVSGRAYLVTPDNFSAIKMASLKAKGIVHIKATLEQFAQWLGQKFPHGLSPRDVLAKVNNYSDDVLHSLTRDDLDIARSLRPIDPGALRTSFDLLAESQKAHLARQFLRGFPPSWSVAASDVPVRLQATEDLSCALEKAITGDEKMFIAIGQSGSGKTTAVMMSLLAFAEKHKEVVLYELSADVKSPRRALNLLKKLGDRKSIVYIGDLFVYGDAFSDDLDALSGQDAIIVSTARTGEWREHLARHLGNRVEPVVFQRFVQKDYDPLIDRLVRYVPAPNFRRLPKKDQHAKLAKSKSQLLIALREATESDNFTDTITNEFEKLPDDDTRQLLLIVGVSTLARVGISREAAYQAYSFVAHARSFEDALAALDGIVALADNRRYYARHELYVRHIIDNLTDFSEFHSVIRSILKTYLKYDIPIVRSVNRLDATLFRFILNHDFIAERARKHGSLEYGREIYSDFEVDFQLDGHFWLQYGLYQAGMRNLVGAIETLKRSIQAYPGNPYAVHALADVQLRAARERDVYDSTTRDLIAEATKALSLQDTQAGLELDQYPIVTLANGHIAALVKHKQIDKAREYAAQYFERLKHIEKQLNSSAVQLTREKMFRFVTVGEWGERLNNGASDKRRRRLLKEPHQSQN